MFEQMSTPWLTGCQFSLLYVNFHSNMQKDSTCISTGKIQHRLFCTICEFSNYEELFRKVDSRQDQLWVWSHGVAQVLLHTVGYDMDMTQRTNEVRIKELVRKNFEIQSGYRDPEKCSVYARCKPALFSNEFSGQMLYFPL